MKVQMCFIYTMDSTVSKFTFQHPTRCLIVGPSCCGKSEFIKRIIRNRHALFSVIPQRVIYTYKYVQSWFHQFPEVEFTRDIPDCLDPDIPSVVVLDDIVCDPKALKECVSLFVRGSHHMNASVFFISQNLFASSADFRTISLNTNQFVLFKTLRGYQQIEYLGRQLYGKGSEFMKAYKEATSTPYSYLLIDLDPQQQHRLRSNIFPGEQEVIYVLE